MNDDGSSHDALKEPAIPTYKRLIIAWLFVPIHRLLFRLSKGRILGRLEGQGVLVLLTKGRRSGKLRASPLMYFQFAESCDLIVVASNYGQDHHPAWYWNIIADANVHFETGGERFVAEARITQGAERSSLFDKVIAANSRFADYRASTDREIPVVVLSRGCPHSQAPGDGSRGSP